MPRVSMKDLADFGTRLLVKKGVAEPKARYMAELAATTEACGVSTHGASVFGYYDNMVGPKIDPAAEPVVVRDSGVMALIDGKRVFSQLAMKLAADLAVKKARKLGAAVVSVRNTSWLAALGVYLLPLAREGLFAQLWAQSSQCKDSAPYGGIDARFSTDPMALAFPTPGGPVVADFSTAVMSMGKAGRMAREGKRAADRVFLDKNGLLTDDPKVMKDGGAMLLLGGDLNGYKGYALALWIEALVAMSGGTCNNPDHEQEQNFTLLVIDPAAFGEMDHYRAEMARFVKHVKSSRVRDGFDSIRLPGEGMLGHLARSEKTGIELAPDLLATLNDVAKRNGIAPVRLMS